MVTNTHFDHQHSRQTKAKQHHMCYIMFKIHLVPLVLGKITCMQGKSQKWTNMKHRRQVDVAGGPWAHMPHRSMTPLPLPHHWSTWKPPHCFSSVDLWRFDPKVHIELPWTHRPAVIHLEGAKLTSKPPCIQPPSRGHPSLLDGEAVQWMVSQPWPTLADAQSLLHCLIFAYKYPHALYTL
jgi:hypothetical protein